jgi:hypothetical protein
MQTACSRPRMFEHDALIYTRACRTNFICTRKESGNLQLKGTGERIMEPPIYWGNVPSEDPLTSHGSIVVYLSVHSRASKPGTENYD